MTGLTAMLHLPLMAILLSACSPAPTQTSKTLAEALDGTYIDPLASASNSLTVLLFASIDCPIANRLTPDIQKIIAAYTNRTVKFWLVYPFADLSTAEIQNHLRTYGYSTVPAVRDPEHNLVRLAKARVTPEAAVFDSQRKLLYHGRINDLYLELGKPRPAATQHDLTTVLEAALAGKPVPFSGKPAVGCYIPDLKK